MTWRKFMACIVIGLLFGTVVGTSYAAMTNSVDGRPTAYWWTGNEFKDDALRNAREVEDMMEGTVAFDTGILLNPTDVEPDVAEGKFYYDDSEKTLRLYTGSSWVSIDTAGASSLDTAYGIGNTIDVSGDAVTFTTGNGDNNVVFAIVQNEADNDNDAFTITMGSNAVGNALLINSQSGGTDIRGDNWDIDQTGSLTGVDIDISGDLTLANGKTIRGTTGSAETWSLQVYDNNTGPGYKDAILFTNGDVPAIAIGDGNPTVAINSSDWDISATGAMTNIGAITMDGLLTGSAGAAITGAAINLNVSSNFAVNVGTGSTTATVTIGGSAAQTINIGDGASAKTVTLGSSNTTSTTTLLSGSGGLLLNKNTNEVVNIATGTSTGTVTIGGAAAQTINIGDGAAAKTVTLGSLNSSSTTTLLSGSGALNLNVSNNQPTNIGSGTTTGTVTIGGAGVQTINIGIGAAAKTVVIGSTNSSSTTTIDNGSGGLTLGNSAGATVIDGSTISMADVEVTNVGDIHVDDILMDANPEIMVAYRTIIKTINSDSDDNNTDYELDDTQSNTTEQVVTLTNIIPAYAEIVSVQLRCYETVTGGNTMGIDIGTSSGSDQIIATANIDTANDISATEAGGSPEVVATNAQRSIYVNFTPGVNWDLPLNEGKWAIMITYLDYGAVFTQDSPP